MNFLKSNRLYIVLAILAAFFILLKIIGIVNYSWGYIVFPVLGIVLIPILLIIIYYLIAIYKYVKEKNIPNQK
jgi:hypothetical protein